MNVCVSSPSDRPPPFNVSSSSAAGSSLAMGGVMARPGIWAMRTAVPTSRVIVSSATSIRPMLALALDIAELSFIDASRLSTLTLSSDSYLSMALLGITLQVSSTIMDALKLNFCAKYGECASAKHVERGQD